MRGFTAGHKFCFLNSDKLTQATQIQLFKKQIAFSEFYTAFFKFR